MNKGKLFIKERLLNLISKNDNSSIRISLKVSEETLKKLENATTSEVNFKTYFNKVLLMAIELQDFSSDTLTLDEYTIKSDLSDLPTKQKTFVISKSANKVLDDFSKFLGLAKNKTFNLLINGYCVFNIYRLIKAQEKNIPVYRKAIEIREQLIKNFYDSYEQLTKLFTEEHDPPLEMYQTPELEDNDPIEEFLANISFADIYLSNSGGLLDKAIAESEKNYNPDLLNKIKLTIKEGKE